MITEIQKTILRQALVDGSVSIKRADSQKRKAAERLAAKQLLRRTGIVILKGGEIISSSQPQYFVEPEADVYEISRKGKALIEGTP